MKKIVALALAMIMVLCVTAALAEPTGKVMLYSSMQDDRECL